MHTFAKNDRVQIVPDSKISLPRGVYEVRDFMPVAPGDQKHAGHHQRLRVGRPGDSWTSDWLSAAHFEPAPEPAPESSTDAYVAEPVGNTWALGRFEVDGPPGWYNA